MARQAKKFYTKASSTEAPGKRPSTESGPPSKKRKAAKAKAKSKAWASGNTWR